MTKGVSFSSVRDSGIRGVGSSGVSGSGVIAAAGVIPVAFNPLQTGANITLSNGNMTATKNSSLAWTIAYADTFKNAGQWYFEAKIDTSGGAGWEQVGLARAGVSLTAAQGLDAANAWSHVNSGNQHIQAATTAFGSTWTTGDVIGVAYNASLGSIEYFKNGVSMGATGVTDCTGDIYPAVGMYRNGVITLRFQSDSFSYAPPSGFEPWAGG